MLNGKWHEVLTGVAVVRVGGESRVDYETTRVRFAEMSEAEIDWYISTGEARGKAGAYGIQGKAALFIEEIAGDYFNIVGLPIRLVYEFARDGFRSDYCAAVDIDSLAVMPRPSSDASNNATAATSSAVTRRFCGLIFFSDVERLFSGAPGLRSDLAQRHVRPSRYRRNPDRSH